MVPSHWVTVDHLPLNDVAKVDCAALLAQLPPPVPWGVEPGTPLSRTSGRKYARLSLSSSASGPSGGGQRRSSRVRGFAEAPPKVTEALPVAQR